MGSKANLSIIIIVIIDQTTDFTFLQGIMIPQLGIASNPWQVTASMNPSSTSGQLSGNLTVSFISGWANFTDLTMNLTVSGVILDFAVTKPNTSSLAVSSNAFDVAVRPYYLSALRAPDMVNENTTFEVIIELRDEITLMIPYRDLMTKVRSHKTIELYIRTRGRTDLYMRPVLYTRPVCAQAAIF